MQGLKNLGSTLQHAAHSFRQSVQSRLGTVRTYVIASRTLLEERLISEGGFAYVLLVREANSSELYAMKKILCQDKERYQMAKREVAVMEKIPQHPNIVRYYGAGILHAPADLHNAPGGGAGDNRSSVGKEGSSSGHKEVCLVLEYCRDGHLLDLLDAANGRLSEACIVQTLLDIATALNHLHSQSPPLVHRDLKLENVLKNDGLFKLCDFGSCAAIVAEIVPVDLPREEMFRLEEDISKSTTLMYRPPEYVDLYSGSPLTVKADIWMFGCIVYSLLFYQHPFQLQSALAITNADYSLPLSSLKASVSEGDSGGSTPSLDSPNNCFDSSSAASESNRKSAALEGVPQTPSTQHDIEKANPEHVALPPLRVSKKIIRLLHWCLAPNPDDRPSAEELSSLLSQWTSLTLAELENSLPAAVLKRSEEMLRVEVDRWRDSVHPPPSIPAPPISLTLGGQSRRDHTQTRESRPHSSGSKGAEYPRATSGGRQHSAQGEKAMRDPRDKGKRNNERCVSSPTSVFSCPALDAASPNITSQLSPQAWTSAPLPPASSASSSTHGAFANRITPPASEVSHADQGWADFDAFETSRVDHPTRACQGGDAMQTRSRRGSQMSSGRSSSKRTDTSTSGAPNTGTKDDIFNSSDPFQDTAGGADDTTLFRGNAGTRPNPADAATSRSHKRVTSLVAQHGTTTPPQPVAPSLRQESSPMTRVDLL